MPKSFRFIVCLLLVMPALCLASPRIAVLQSFSDIESGDNSRQWLAGFDAKLQAELLTGWDCEVLSRSGLSAVVFEQKLAAAKDAEVAPPLVLPAEALVITVLDTQRKQLRMHVTRVADGMQLGAPKVFRFKNIKQLSDKLPGQAAQYLAKTAKLKAPKNSAPIGETAAAGLTCALLDPISSESRNENLNGLATLFRASLEQEIAGLEQPVELVERGRIADLLEETNLAASGVVGTNGSANLGRLVGADLILIPFVHVISGNSLNSTLFAIDTKSGRILAARTWSGKALDPPPAKILQGLLTQALDAASSGNGKVADNAAMRHAEALFIIGLRDSFGGLRQSRGTEAELALNLADASLALAYDDTVIMREAVTKLGSKAVPEPLTPLEKELHPNTPGNEAILALMESGRLSELHDQARRIFGLSFPELQETDGDIFRLARYHIRLGEADKACALLESQAPDLDTLAANNTFYGTYAQALLAAGRHEDCVKFIVKRQRWSGDVTRIYLDALHATGDFEKEYRTMWINRKSSMKTATTDELARFLKLAVDHGEPAEALVAFSRFANAWRRNDAVLRVPLVKLRIAAGQKERAVSDAQCMWLASRISGDKGSMKELEGLLEGLGAETLERLPTPSEAIKFPAGTRIDLIHDKTLKPDFVSKVAQEMADFWGCEVHVFPSEIDGTKLSSYNKLNKSIEGREFARGIVHFTEHPGNLLQTVFLTDHKLRSTENNYVGDIYGITSLGNSVQLISSYYFRAMKEHDPRPLELSTAIAAAELPVVARKIRYDQLESDPEGEYFFTFNPDIMSSNGNLTMRDLVLGVAPSTKQLLAGYDPLDFLKLAEEFREKDRLEEQKNPAPDAGYFRKISPILAGSKPIVITPQPTN